VGVAQHAAQRPPQDRDPLRHQRAAAEHRERADAGRHRHHDAPHGIPLAATPRHGSGPAASPAATQLAATPEVST
jgi:hypothetical protein